MGMEHHLSGRRQALSKSSSPLRWVAGAEAAATSRGMLLGGGERRCSRLAGQRQPVGLGMARKQKNPPYTTRVLAIAVHLLARADAGTARVFARQRARGNKKDVSGAIRDFMADLLDRIVTSADICGGKPCIRGTRIWVSLILDFLASGVSEAELLEEYPQLRHEDVLAAFAFAARRVQET